MKLKESKLTPVRTTTYGVGHEELPVLSCIKLSVMFLGIGFEGKSHFTTMVRRRHAINLQSNHWKVDLGLHSHAHRHQVLDATVRDRGRRCHDPFELEGSPKHLDGRTKGR